MPKRNVRTQNYYHRNLVKIVRYWKTLITKINSDTKNTYFYTIKPLIKILYIKLQIHKYG